MPAIAHVDALWSSFTITPDFAGARRLKPKETIVMDYSVTINAHLRIPDSIIDASTTQEQFRACLDRHVFLWPTVKDCLKMLDTYTRREPDEPFAVLAFDAYSLLSDHYAAVKLSKYDSGSSPRYPVHCSYRKSPGMFLPLQEFQRVTSSYFAAKPSEIREILVENKVMEASNYLRAVYTGQRHAVPECWSGIAKPLADLYGTHG